uniref:7TM_GPCR_Srx domain-containing protein n=1 Tax=Heterorhabditis bacteriophora TaxID=37862 RepID=A0A1I7WHS7_HETBA
MDRSLFLTYCIIMLGEQRIVHIVLSLNYVFIVVFIGSIAYISHTTPLYSIDTRNGIFFGGFIENITNICIKMYIYIYIYIVGR